MTNPLPITSVEDYLAQLAAAPNAAHKAHVTRRAMKAGFYVAPAVEPKAPNKANGSAAANKAWETRRARNALAAASSIAPIAIAPVAEAKPKAKAKPVADADEDEDLPAKLESKATLAARKAHETRRLVAEAREAAEARRNGVEEASPLDDRRMVELYLDNDKVGCGNRRYIVLDIGTREVRLCYAPTLTVLKVDRRTFDKDAKPARNFYPRKLAAMIQENLATRSALYPDAKARYERIAKDALRALKPKPAEKPAPSEGAAALVSA